MTELAPPGKTPSRREQLVVLAAALFASIEAILWSWRNQAFLLYGDAEAHIHIARRLFDSNRPGLTQLGSVWLPLPHLLMLPFVAIDPWWRSGFGPAIPSALCYILACLGLYKLARKWLSPAAAALGLAFFALNPNLLYLQTTAMTEPLFLCELIWCVLLLVEWYECLRKGERRAERILWAIVAVLICAVYTRYDGWILAFLAWAAMAVCLYRRGQLFRRNFVLASIVLALAPAGWMLYNAVVFQDWLDFMRGPYSAKAIEARTASSAVDPHPGWHNPWIALKYFLKAAEMDSSAALINFNSLFFATALFCTGVACLQYSAGASHSPNQRQEMLGRPSDSAWLWTLFLWLPLPFYAYSVSYGSVPIFLPVWKPFSWYNTRYGMEMIPAFAFFAGCLFDGILISAAVNHPRLRRLAIAFFALAIAANAAEMLREHPLTYVEAQKNTAARGYYNAVIPAALAHLHQLDPTGEILMNTSMYPSLIPNAGLTYRQTINESDKQFYWAALDYPAAHASIILAFAGDDIDKAVHAHPEHLRVYQRFHSPNQGWDQADATLYVTDTFPGVATTPLSTAVPAR